MITKYVFILMSTGIMVFWSEKVYWYIQGYSMLELLLYYFIGVYWLLRVISWSKINDVWGLMVASILYPLYVEGVITGIIIYNPFMLFYFFGWHSILSVIIGWYYQHKQLITGSAWKISLTSISLGWFWGLWSIVYWLPESINDPELISQGFLVGKWGIAHYALLVFYLGLLYLLFHFILSLTIRADLAWSRIEDGIFGFVLLVLFLLQLIQSYGLALLLVGLISIPLFVLHRKNPVISSNHQRSILHQLQGKIAVSRLLLLWFMPVTAVLTYSLFYMMNPPFWFIRGVYWFFVSTQFFGGGIIMLLALLKVLRQEFEVTSLIRT